MFQFTLDQPLSNGAILKAVRPSKFSPNVVVVMGRFDDNEWGVWRASRETGNTMGGNYFSSQEAALSDL